MRLKLPEKYDKAKIFFSEVSDGAMNRSWPEAEENIRQFLEKTGARGKLCSGGQPHGTTVEVVNKARFNKNADGILTMGPARNALRQRMAGGDHVLGVKTADCVPLLLFDPQSRLLGAIHISRGNLIAGIVSESLKHTLQKVGASPLSANFFLGPHVRVKNYPQKEEKAARIKKTRFAKFLLPCGKDLHFDLTSAVKSELEEIGASADNILDSGIDTFSDERFFSSRRRSEGEPLKCFLSIIFRK